MAKNAITDYDTDPTLNTDVGSIGIQGTNIPSNFDNSQREIMSHLADMNAGTSPLHDTFTLADPDDHTKRIRLDAGNISTSTTRVFSLPDSDGVVWTSGNDGSGSGLDADLLDGLQANAFARKDQEETFAANINVNGASIYVGQGLTGAGSSHLWYRDASNGINYALFYDASFGGIMAQGRNGLSGPLVISDSSGYARNANMFRSEDTGGRMWLDMPNQLDFHWNSGFYYRIDGNAYVLINSSPSDQNFKDRVNFSGHIFDEIKKVGVVRYTPKDGIPVAMPEGERDGFYAQELVKLDPNLVQEMPVPFEREYEKGENGELVSDADGNTIPIPHELDGETFLSLAPDAHMQLIAKLWRAVGELIMRSEKSNDEQPIIDESKMQSLDEIKSRAISVLHVEHGRVLRLATGRATPEEQKTWFPKAQAASAILKGSSENYQDAILKPEADKRGFSLNEMSNYILEKSKAYHELVGLAAEKHFEGQAAINSAATKEVVELELEKHLQSLKSLLSA